MQFFGEKLKELRKKHRLSQQQLADYLGVTAATVSAYELGKKLPSIVTLINICRQFDVSSDYLLGLSDPMDLLKSELTNHQISIIRQLIKELESKNK